jgi:hypothetical protein
MQDEDASRKFIGPPGAKCQAKTEVVEASASQQSLHRRVPVFCQTRHLVFAAVDGVLLPSIVSNGQKSVMLNAIACILL